MILTGDCVEQMREMDEGSIDAVVCDPPYGLEFMGKEWDRLDAGADVRQPDDEDFHRSGAGPFDRAKVRHGYDTSIAAMQEWHHAWATEALRILKPGGHLLAFGGTRTYHRLACAVEDAGFEIRDSLIWLYGSGFPKSLDVSKAIDKAERGVPQGGADPTSPNAGKYRTQATEGKRGQGDSGQGYGAGPGQFMAEQGERDNRELSAAAQPWNGWGTALKPGHEPIVVARKPLSGTVAQNVTEHGTGALNIDGCRIGTSDRLIAGGDMGTLPGDEREGAAAGMFNGDAPNTYEQNTAGRWPANVALSPEAAAELDEQTGERPGATSFSRPKEYGATSYQVGDAELQAGYDDRGGASRFFYCAKASRGERNAGLDGLPKLKSADAGYGSIQEPKLDRAAPRENWDPHQTANTHPTVKPIDLMRWLVRLVTPPGGTVLDPFTGSGTTGCAAVLEGFEFIGIEREAEYATIAEARIAWWSKQEGETEEILIRAGFSERIEREHRERGQESLFAEGV